MLGPNDANLGTERHVRLPSLVDLPGDVSSNISFDKGQGTFTPIKKSDNYFHAKAMLRFDLLYCITFRIRLTQFVYMLVSLSCSLKRCMRIDHQMRDRLRPT